MPVETASWIGQELAAGRYQVTARLGEGGMGYVYRARDRNLDTDVVIKVPRRSMLEDPEFAGRFAREIRSLVHLAHPHVVKVLDVGTHEDLPFAVMQFLSGGSLRDRQPQAAGGGRQPVVPERLRDWLEPVAGALDFIHKQRYVHRDVKPDNILFDAHGHAYLSDFGVAKVLAGSARRETATVHTEAGIVLGTPQYMAPELVMGRPFDGRVDQYALAVTVYELLAGRYPFTGPTSAAIFVQQTTKAAPPLETVAPGLPPGLTAAVQKGLAKKLGERFPDCQSFARAVLDGLAGAAPAITSVQATPPPPAAPPPPAPPPTRTAAYRLTCPGCRKPIRLAADDLGKKVTCPSCGKEVQTPSRPRTPPAGSPARPGAETKEESVRADTPPPSSPQPATPSSLLAFGTTAPAPRAPKKLPRVPLVAAGAAGVLLLAGLLGYWIIASRSPKKADVTRPQEPAGSKTSPDTGLANKGAGTSPVPPPREKPGADLPGDPVERARAVLAENPGDPSANATLGKYLCLEIGDFDKGVPLLALGNDHTFGPVASRDAFGATEPDKQRELGDAWWELAEQETGRARENLQRRAAFWYRKALPGVGARGGPDEDRVRGRLEGVDGRPAPKAPPPTETDPAQTAPPAPATPTVLQYRILAFRRSKTNYARHQGLSFQVGLGKDPVGFGAAGVEVQDLRRLKVEVEVFGTRQAHDDNDCVGFIVDYRTPGGYTKRVALGRFNSKRRAVVPFWGKRGAPDQFVTGKPSKVYTLDLKDWAPPDWDGTVWFTTLIQNWGPNTGLNTRLFIPDVQGANR